MYGGLLILAIANYRELTMSKVSGPHGFATFPDLPTLISLFGKFSEANYLAGGSIESVNHLWTANHNII